MRFAYSDLRATLIAELRQAASVDIAVAFCNPDNDLLAALRRVPRVRLLIASDFQINNPAPLESLSTHGHWVRAVSGEQHGGNLHSKVYLVSRRDGSTWAMVGSANLTRPGLSTNQEACVVFDSREKGDATPLKEIREWLAKLFAQEYDEIDYELARSVYTTRNGRRTTVGGNLFEATDYWALKPGWLGEFWQHWLAESVVTMGWAGLGDPAAMSRGELVSAYRRAFRLDKKQAVATNVAQIARFTHDMKAGDLVLICGRYDSVGKVDKNAYIYGIARLIAVDGQCHFYDPASDWHQFKRHATIQRIEQFLPRSLIAKALGVGAIVPTILALNAEGFSRLFTLLEAQLGIAVSV